MQLESFLLRSHGWVPNHPRLPVLFYRQALAAGDAEDDAAAFEARFARHGWPPQWRAGIYDFHHYHSTAHEVLGVARGTARLVLGGPGGREMEAVAGDALLLPAGTGHRCLACSDDLLVVGAYPPAQCWDICRAAASPAMLERIAHLPFPATDPVAGAHRPLAQQWSPAT